jgi:hypothetical protein
MAFRDNTDKTAVTVLPKFRNAFNFSNLTAYSLMISSCGGSLINTHIQIEVIWLRTEVEVMKELSVTCEPVTQVLFRQPHLNLKF